MRNQKSPLRSILREEKTKIVQKIVKVNGQECIKEYQRGKLLGRGGFALCYLAKSLENNTQFAIKIISKEILKNPRTKFKVKNRFIQLENEIKLHKTLHHKNIVQLYNNFEDEFNVYIFLELCPNESLNQLLMRSKKLRIAQIQRFIRQIISGVKYLHSRNIIHRDLKLGNIFLGENLEIKIGDFGLGTKLDFQNDKKRSICGTPNYIAPQIIDGHGYSYPVDIWSIGVMIYTLLIGTPPFETDNIQETYELIKKGKYIFPQQSNIPQCAKTLINQILNSDPYKRPTLDDILESPFMQLGTKSTILKQINSISLNKSMSSYSLSPSDTIASSIEKQSKSRIRVQDFIETPEGWAYGMSNGLIGLHQKDRILLYSKFFGDLYVVTKSDKGKDMVVRQLGEQIKPLQKEVNKYRFLAKENNHSQGSLIYVRKFLKHKDFHTFRLSNQVVQLKFSDNCQILINKYLMVTFISPTKQIIFGSFDEILDANNQLFKKKARYAKEMIDVLSVKRGK